VWSTLFTEDNDKINYDLRTSCIARIGEANERLQYAKLFAPVILAPAEEILGEGISHMEKQEYPECLSKAIEVKVRSNTLLTALGITNEQLPELVSKKLRVAEREIISQEYFPILAYSYYEYSKSLKDSDPGSALLYSEYALEMTNMESYLSIINGNGKTIDNIEKEIINNSENIRLIITGLLIGLLIGSSFAFSRIKKKNDL
jgi:predicted S18 family serine protease